MTRVHYVPAATVDLDDIYFRIAVENEPAADRLIGRIKRAAFRLRDFPLSGPERAEYGRDLRSLSVANHVILYRAGPNEVTILRILHGARDLTNLEID